MSQERGHDSIPEPLVSYYAVGKYHYLETCNEHQMRVSHQLSRVYSMLGHKSLLA
jgi:hypothetical protein